MLIERKLDEVLCRVQKSPKNYFCRIAQEWVVYASSPRSATKLLHSPRYGTEVVHKFYDAALDVRLNHVNWYVEGVQAGEFEPTLLFFGDEARHHLIGYVTSDSNRYWSAQSTMLIFGML